MPNSRRSRWLRRCLALVIPTVLGAGAVFTIEEVHRPAAGTQPAIYQPAPTARANDAEKLNAIPALDRASGHLQDGAAADAPTRAKPMARPRLPSKVVYLTFDDRPSRHTSRILSVLRRTGSTATFFQLGVNRPGRAGQIRAILRQGSNIGNHTYSHAALTRLSAREVRWQLRHGPRAKCFRSPYGATNSAVRRAARAAGMRQVLWTIDPQDWSRPGTTALARVGASRGIRNHSIILLHDSGGDRTQTVRALPKLIANLHARGYRVRALPYCS